jgi:alpha-pyrone synthase
MCSVTPELPETLPPSPAISFKQKVLGGAALLLSVWVGYTTLVFPGQRVLTWFEICTDGFAPRWLASDAQHLLGSHYKEALKRGFLDDISGAVLDHLSKWGGGDVLELAAGAGRSTEVWQSLFVEKGLCTRTILTDLLPNTKAWDEVASGVATPTTSDNQVSFDFDCGSFGYIASPVDATKAAAAAEAVVPNYAANGKELRMIHLSLHHFSPDTVKSMLEDATSSQAALLIVDHAPNAGGALYNGLLVTKQLIKRIPTYLINDPIKILLAPVLPVILLGIFHDSTVSILRAYSHDQLKEMIQSVEGGDKYDIQMFKSPTYLEWIGVPSFLRGFFPGADGQVMNFVLATPPTKAVSSKRRSKTNVSLPSNSKVKVYGVASTGSVESSSVSAGVQLLILSLLGAVAYLFATRQTSKKQKRPAADDDELVGSPSILAIGTANPPYCWTLPNVEAAVDYKRTNTNMSDDYMNFMKKVHKTSGVETRYFGDPAPDAEKLARGEPPEGIYSKEGNPTVSDRHAYWAEWAPKMAIEAATKAVNNWGGDKSDITHVIFHSCTGFKAPGIELDVVDALKLTGVKRRLGINYMGCFGAFTGMSVAKAFCEADPNAVVLLVCAECCFSHIAFSENRSKCIGNCFFADGGAAAIIGPGRPGDWAITDQQTKTLGPETRGLMTWQPNDHSYDMYLDKGIGLKFGMHLFWNLKSYLSEICPESVRDIEWCVHPGGKGILDFFCSDKLNLGIDKTVLKRSYDVLRNYGNMSSGTILFVLQEMLKESKENPDKVKPVAVCFGFGPGLTLEIAELRRIGTTPGAGPEPTNEPHKSIMESDCEDSKTVPSDSEDSIRTRTSDSS